MGIATLDGPVMTKDIRTAHVQVACDICGRTLLRGERAETYLAGGSRREVCELCAPRARHEGWVREGAALERGTRSASGERRRSVLARLRRPARPGESAASPGDPPPPAPRSGGTGWRGASRSEEEAAPSPQRPELPAAARREPRQVRAVPTSAGGRTATAVERFNASEHARTVSGVARSLGAPFVVVRPLAGDDDGSLVSIVVSWELCWYRYEVDVAGGGSSVRPAGQGYELDELAEEDRVEPNAAADEYGALALL